MTMQPNIIWEKLLRQLGFDLNDYHSIEGALTNQTVLIKLISVMQPEITNILISEDKKEKIIEKRMALKLLFDRVWQRADMIFLEMGFKKSKNKNHWSGGYQSSDAGGKKIFVNVTYTKDAPDSFYIHLHSKGIEYTEKIVEYLDNASIYNFSVKQNPIRWLASTVKFPYKF